MKAIIISEEAFDRAFDDFAKDIEIAKYETLEYVPAAELGDRDAVARAHRKWVYHLRTLQDRLRKER